VIVFSAGMYINTRASKVFYEMITMTQNNYFEQCVISFKEYYKEIASNIQFIQNSRSLKDMVRRYQELTEKERKSALSSDETYEKYNLKVDIRDFLKKIAIQQGMYSLHYGKTATSPLYVDIAVFTPNSIISSAEVGGISVTDNNIYNITDAKDHTVHFLSNGQLLEMGIGIKEQPCVIFSIFEDNEKLCSIILLLNKSYIERTIHSSENVVIADNNNNVMFKGSNMDPVNWQSFSEEKSGVMQGQYAQRTHEPFLKKAVLNVQNIYLYYRVNTHEYNQVSIRLRQYLFITMVISLLLGFIISKYQAKRIISPVVRINQQISGFPQKKTNMEASISQPPVKVFSLHERLTYYFIATIIFPFVLFMMVCYFSTMNEFKKYIYDYTQSIVEMEAGTVSKIIERKAKSFFVFLNEPNVWQGLMNGDTEVSDIQAALEQGVFMGIGNSRVMLMDKNGEHQFYSNETIIDRCKNGQEFSQLYKSIFPIKWELENNLLGEYTLTLWIPVFSLENTSFESFTDMERVGIAALFIDFREIESIFYNISEIDREVYLSYGMNSLFNIYHRTETAVDPNIITEKVGLKSRNNIQVTKKIDSLDWKVISVFSETYMDSKTRSISMDCVYCLSLVMLLAIIYSFTIAKVVLKPVNRLNFYFNTVELDSISDIDINDFFIDEIDTIGKNFVKMMERINQLVDELLLSQYNINELYKIGKSAKFKALQAQITPHFLYNTLDTIIQLVQRMQTEKAVLMIQALSDLFRYSVTDNESTITVGEEIKYAESYTNILTVRYMDTISFTWEIDYGVEQYECIRMILQPLIENCVIHAFTDETLDVIVRCKISGEHVIFCVEDNGRGMGETELSELINRIKAGKLHDAQIGLNNVHLKLKLIYGDLYDMDITSLPGKGTSVAIRIPAKIKS